MFLNEGKFVPKYFTNTNKDTLIFKLEIPDYKETPSLKVFSQGTNIVEMEANTTFFSDFYKEGDRDLLWYHLLRGRNT